MDISPQKVNVFPILHSRRSRQHTFTGLIDTPFDQSDA
jgi:hypothetical protein